MLKTIPTPLQAVADGLPHLSIDWSAQKNVVAKREQPGGGKAGYLLEQQQLQLRQMELVVSREREGLLPDIWQRAARKRSYLLSKKSVNSTGRKAGRDA